MPEQFSNVEDYLAALAPDVRAVLLEVRAAVHEAVPGGEDGISYNIPVLRLGGRSVVQYAGWKRHVSLYPVPEGDDDLKRDLAAYVAGRGTLRLPLAEPLPRELVVRVATALVAERHAPDQG